MKKNFPFYRLNPWKQSKEFVILDKKDNEQFFLCPIYDQSHEPCSLEAIPHLPSSKKKKKKMSLVYIKASYLKRRKLWWSEDKINKYNSNNN